MQDLEDVLGKELRVEKLADGTVVSRWYECQACDGIGSHEVYYNEYDIYDQECLACEGRGEIEVF